MATSLKDLTGQRFGKLTVVERCEDKIWKSDRRRPQWLCLCDCGEYKKVASSYLINGHTTSCGCNRIRDLAGKVFGNLTVIKFHGRRIQPNGSVRTEWVCLCRCGEETIVSHGNLASGHTTSCGCITCSAQEAVIKHILDEKQISYKKEYTFADFISSGSKPRPFRFDFALFDLQGNLLALLEYQGRQHYVEQPGFEDYGAGQRYYSDKAKREYCAKRNIPLYEITYLDNTETELNKILHAIYDNPVPSAVQTAKV